MCFTSSYYDNFRFHNKRLPNNQIISIGCIPCDICDLKLVTLKPVSYTHLDVYKRQLLDIACVFAQN